MALKLINAAVLEPLDLAEVKAHLRVDHTTDDGLIAIYLRAAVANLEGSEGFLGRALVTQTWDLYLDQFPTAEVRIPLPPLQSVTHVKYDDAAGVEQTVDPGDYTVDTVSEPGWVVPNTGFDWPTPLFAVNAVRVRFIAGYSPSTDSPPDLAANVPGSVKAGILLHIGSMYEHRENVVVGQTAVQLPWGAEQLLRPHRMQLGMA